MWLKRLSLFWSIALGLSIYFLGTVLAPIFAIFGVILFWIAMAEETQASGRKFWVSRFFLHWFWGSVFYVFSVPWVATAIERFAGVSKVPALVSMLVIILIQGLEGPFFLLLYRIAQPLPHLLRAPCAWGLREALVPRFLPWYLSAAFIDLPFIQGYFPVFGSAGTSFIILLSLGYFLSVLWKRTGTSKLLLAGLLPLVVGFLLRELTSTPIAKTLNVAVVQANLRKPIEWTSFSGLEKLRRMTGNLLLSSQEKPDLIVWPESAVPSTFHLEQKTLVMGTEHDPFPGLDVPILFGSQTKLPPLFPPRETYGVSALLLLPGGNIAGHYLKQRLFPFSEEIPLARYFSALNRFHPRDFDTSFADTPQSLALPYRGEKLMLGVHICYEDLYPEAFLANQVGLDVVILNDVWFSGLKTAEQHETLSRLRALEFSRPLLRVSNSGISTLINSRGQELWRLAQDEEFAGIYKVPFTSPGSRSFYSFFVHFEKEFSLTSILFLVISAISGRRFSRLRGIRE